MKKTYIEPQCTVVAVNAETMVCVSGNVDNEYTITTRDGIGAREVIQQDIKDPDAWGEW